MRFSADPKKKCNPVNDERQLTTYNFDLRHHDPLFNLLPYYLDFTQQIVVILPQIRSFNRHEPKDISYILAW